MSLQVTSSLGRDHDYSLLPYKRVGAYLSSVKLNLHLFPNAKLDRTARSLITEWTLSVNRPTRDVELHHSSHACVTIMAHNPVEYSCSDID